MSELPADWNDLDRAIFAATKSRSHMPEFFRQLVASELIALVPYHPEMEGAAIKIENDAPFPFSMLRDKQGDVVPLFSSIERMEEALRKARIPDRTYLPGDIGGREILEVLGVMKMRAVINKSCRTGEITLNHTLMTDLANGTALAPSDTPFEQKKFVFTIIDPADYPTHLVQPAFEKMQKHPAFRAAWIFTQGGPEDRERNRRNYNLLVLMEPPDDQLYHDLSMIVQLARQKGDEVILTQMDETNTDGVRDFFTRFPNAFYTAR